jgi:hypothetical protein
MQRLSATSTFRVSGGSHAVEVAARELPVIQVAMFGTTGVTLEINTANFNSAGFLEREHATVRLKRADALALVRMLAEILDEAADGADGRQPDLLEAAA